MSLLPYRDTRGRFISTRQRSFGLYQAVPAVYSGLVAASAYSGHYLSKRAQSSNMAYGRARQRKLTAPTYGKKRKRVTKRRVVRRKTTTRRRKTPDRLLSMRLGNKSATGGRTVNQDKRYIDDLCATCFASTGTTAGDSLAWDITNYNDPLTDASSAGTLAEQGTLKNHPHMHDDALVGYDKCRIISSSYRLFVKNTAGNRDFIVAWCFSDNGITPLTWTAGTVTIDNWKDIQGSRGWQWKRFSSLGGGNPGVPSSGYIYIKIPSVFKLTQKLTNMSTDLADTQKLTKALQLSHALADNATGPTYDVYLHLMLFNPEGVAFTAGHVIIEVQWRGKVELLRSRDSTTIVDEADQYA